MKQINFITIGMVALIVICATNNAYAEDMNILYYEYIITINEIQPVYTYQTMSSLLDSEKSFEDIDIIKLKISEHIKESYAEYQNINGNFEFIGVFPLK